MKYSSHPKIALSLLLSAISILAISCSEDNTSTLPALKQPGELCIVEQCIIGNHLKPMDETECSQAGGTFTRMVFAANMSTSTVSYIPYYPKSTNFETIDITTAVPGVTSIPTADRPQSMATDELGAFVVLTSSIQNEISVISTILRREIAFQKLDKKPVKIVWHKSSHAFQVLFTDGTVRELIIKHSCPGSEIGEMTYDCEISKDQLTLEWKNLYQVADNIIDFVQDPTRPVNYISYRDKRYISVIGDSEEAGTCLDSSTHYPCEVQRLGAGFGCADGIDNDGNGLIDSQDPSCFYPWSVEGNATNPEDIQVGWIGVGECNDFNDNNHNGLIDMLDPGCVSSNDASEDPGFQPMTYGSCADNLDNDGDGDTDRSDLKCKWPVDDEDESFGSHSLSVGMCRDSIDNDSDEFTDESDLACYGPNGLSEISLVSEGRGKMAIDPKGRWLYVLDPEDAQIIVIDLETGKTIDRSGWFPRNRVIGIPVSRLPLDIVADIRTETLYNKNNRKVLSERAVVFVSSSSGSIAEYSIHETYAHLENDVLIKQMDMLTMRATDTDDDASYIGSVRCVGRICTETDLPVIDLIRRPTIQYLTDINQLTDINPSTNQPLSVIYDTVIASETWRATYEGTLERDERYDGYFDQNGLFHTSINLCTLGARPGDHLILRNNKGLKNTQEARCQIFESLPNGQTPNLEWTIQDVGPETLTLAPTGIEGDVTVMPDFMCFSNGLEFEIRASNEWLITSRSTYVNRRLTVGKHCVDNPLNPFGQTRFSFDPANPEDISASINAQTAFFSIKMPTVSRKYSRDDAFEFTTRTGLSSLSVTVGSAPTDMALFKTSSAHFLLISEASADSIAIYDIDEEGIDDTL